MTNIYDLTNLLRDVRSRYQAEYIDATETKKKELARLKRTMIPNTPEYENKKQEIQLACDMAILKAKEKAAKKAAEEIESMKEWERTSAGIINTETLARVNALRGIPVTDLPLDSSLDVKLNVLDQLSGQLDLLLEHYSLTVETREAQEARFLYLNDSILDNAVKIYNNEAKDLSEADAAERAYYKIKAMSGQMSKAVAIANSMRNLKRKIQKICCFIGLLRTIRLCQRLTR